MNYSINKVQIVTLIDKSKNGIPISYYLQKSTPGELRKNYPK